jgi:hypothetical protein
MDTNDIILGVLLGWFVLWCVAKAFSLGGGK